MKFQLVFQIALVVLIGNADAQAKKSKTPRARGNLQVAVRERYCQQDEKVGMSLKKKVLRPGLSKFHELRPEELSNSMKAPFTTLTQKAFTKPEIRGIRVWEVTPNKESGKWLIANLQLDSQDSGEENAKFAFCAFTAVQRAEGEKPDSLFSPCIYSLLPRFDPNSEASRLAPRGLEPYDLADLDGDGKNEVIMKATTGYSQSLEIFKVGTDGWRHILEDCAGGD